MCALAVVVGCGEKRAKVPSGQWLTHGNSNHEHYTIYRAWRQSTRQCATDHQCKMQGSAKVTANAGSVWCGRVCMVAGRRSM